jgi:hypothetical protein
VANKIEDFRRDARSFFSGLVAVPIICFWAFLSLLPIGGIFSGSPATLGFWINAFFFASGLFGAVAGYYLLRTLMWPKGRASIEAPSRVLIACYAVLWSVLYLAFRLSMR